MFEMIEKIESKDDFIKFLKVLAEDFQQKQNEWQNRTVNEYIEAISDWIEDYSTAPNNNIDWNGIDYKTLSKIFYMGKYYE